MKFEGFEFWKNETTPTFTANVGVVNPSTIAGTSRPTGNPGESTLERNKLRGASRLA
ncbi:unannotated protein [freshwater metagenome]|uniref:Unannotated protein n=1 Tax=freshwater metagenome TaxID=449393 RepID=A0A6J6KNS9_9ZZZZ